MRLPSPASSCSRGQTLSRSVQPCSRSGIWFALLLPFACRARCGADVWDAFCCFGMDRTATGCGTTRKAAGELCLRSGLHFLFHDLPSTRCGIGSRQRRSSHRFMVRDEVSACDYRVRATSKLHCTARPSLMAGTRRLMHDENMLGVWSKYALLVHRGA